MPKAKPVVSAVDKRKPPAPPPQSEAARAKFVAAGAAASRKREGDKDREKLTVYIDPDVLEAVRVLCVRKRQQLSDFTTEALRKLLEEQNA